MKKFLLFKHELEASCIDKLLVLMVIYKSSYIVCEGDEPGYITVVSIADLTRVMKKLDER